MQIEDIQDELVGLPEVAERLGVHRATANEMVHDGRLRAARLGAHWFVARRDLEEFAASYQRPKNSPRSRADGAVRAIRSAEILDRLLDWHDATAEEVGAVIDLHPGNVRKYLCLLEADGLVVRNEYGSWMLTGPGRQAALGKRPHGGRPGHGERFGDGHRSDPGAARLDRGA